MQKNRLSNTFTNKHVTEPDDAWDFVVERARRGVDRDLQLEVKEAFAEHFYDRLVVGNSVVPEQARRFKAKGFPLEVIRGPEGVYIITVTHFATPFVLYQNDELTIKLIDTIVDNQPIGTIKLGIWRRVARALMGRV